LGIKTQDIAKPEWLDQVVERYHFQTLDDMYAGIGFGSISVNKICARLLDKYNEEHEDAHFEERIEELSNAKPIRPVNSKTGVVVKGIDNCLVKLSKCCAAKIAVGAITAA
jgi:GTP pyrophosphokinase